MIFLRFMAVFFFPMRRNLRRVKARNLRILKNAKVRNLRSDKVRNLRSLKVRNLRSDELCNLRGLDYITYFKECQSAEFTKCLSANCRSL